MSIRKRGKIYSYDFTVNGNRFRGSCETDDFGLAKAIEAKKRTDALMQAHLGVKERITLDAALGRYWMEHAQYLRSHANIRGYGQFWLGYFGKDKQLNEITDSDLSACVADMRKTLSNATINRHLALLGGLFTMAARKWKFDVGNADIRQHMLDEPEARTRWITAQEAEKLISAAAPHLKPIIRFALLTGCRKENIIGLKWEQVRLHQRVIRFSVKSAMPGGKNHEIPISEPLKELLVSLNPGQGYVFTYAEGRVKQLRRSWKTACKKAGIVDFRFHDLRHTAASWMVQKGVPLDVIQAILGHSQLAMTQKYAHRDNTDKLKAMEVLGASHIRHKARRMKK